MYRPLANHAIGGGGGQGRSSSKQVWTGFQWWPPDVSSGEGDGPQVLCLVICDLSNDACYASTPLPFPTRYLWKHYLPATSFASGNNDLSDSTDVHNKHYFQLSFHYFEKLFEYSFHVGFEIPSYLEILEKLYVHKFHRSFIGFFLFYIGK